MATSSVNVEVRFDEEGFRAELLRRLALTSGTAANIERIAVELLNEGRFIHIGPEIDILDAEIIGD